MNRSAALLFAAAAACAPVYSATPKQNEQVAQLYERGLAGDSQAVMDCVLKLEAILKSEPKNQLARVYLGSAYTMRSRDLGFGPGKLSTLNKGVALMDEASAAAPDDAQVRLVRALTDQSLPFFAGRRKKAQDELCALAEILEHDSKRLAPADRQRLFLNAGRVAHERGDAQRAANFWRLGLTNPVDPKLTAELNAALAQP